MTTQALQKFTKSFTVQRVDEDQRLVYGIASSPTIDAQGDIVTSGAMEAALPDFMEWGNLRYMHNDGRIDAVGKVIEAHIGPDGKTYITAKVVDDSAWAKVKAGVLQAFSIGGEVLEAARQWIEGQWVNVITRLKLDEISLVDNPAHKEAKILMYKSNTTSPKGKNQMKEILKPVAGEGDESVALVDVKKATQAVSQLKKRNVKKASAANPPDPDKLVNQLLALHNSLVLAGNIDGADSVTDAIACLQMATGSAGVDAVDPAAGAEGEGDGSEPGAQIALAAGMDDSSADSGPADADQADQAPVSKADGGGDDIDEQADNEPEGGDGGQNQDFSQDGSNIYQVTDNETSPDEVDDSQPDAKDPIELAQGAITRKGQGHGHGQTPTQALVRSRIQQIRQSRQFESNEYQLQKATMNDLKKFAGAVAEVLQEMQDKIEKLESRTVANRGPVRMQVAENRDVAKGMSGNSGKDANSAQSQIAELEARIRGLSNAQEKEKAGKELGLIQIKQALGYLG